MDRTAAANSAFRLPVLPAGKTDRRAGSELSLISDSKLEDIKYPFAYQNEDASLYDAERNNSNDDVTANQTRRLISFFSNAVKIIEKYYKGRYAKNEQEPSGDRSARNTDNVILIIAVAMRRAGHEAHRNIYAQVP